MKRTDGVQGDRGEAFLDFDGLIQLSLPLADQLASAAGKEGHERADLLVLERGVHGSVIDGTYFYVH
jgi:hypothetical protein